MYSINIYNTMILLLSKIETRLFLRWYYTGKLHRINDVDSLRCGVEASRFYIYYSDKFKTVDKFKLSLCIRRLQ